jgi:hypothetical protein
VGGSEGARGESPAERLDRNWGDLVQELRVVQTGVQFLTGFLLTLPFQQRFTQLTGHQQALYLATVSASVASTAFLQAPVSVHQALFRRHQRRRAVLVAHRVAMAGIAFLAAAIVGVAGIIFDVVSGTLAAAVAAAVIAVVLGLLWLAFRWPFAGLPSGPRHPAGPDQVNSRTKAATVMTELTSSCPGAAPAEHRTRVMPAHQAGLARWPGRAAARWWQQDPQPRRLRREIRRTGCTLSR